MKKTVSVFGGGGEAAGETIECANNLGRNLAENDVAVVCGGKEGVMEAVSRGVREGGGLCIGIIPSMDKGEANRYVDVALPTGMGYARNIFVASAGDACIAFSGSTGTLSEIALALNNGKTVFIVEDSGGVCGGIRDLLEGIKHPGEVVYTRMSEVCGDVLGHLKLC